MGAFFQNGARNRQPLALAAAQPQPALADHRIVSFRQRHDEVVGQRRARRFFHLVRRNFRMPVGDVVAHRVVEQNGVLGDDGDLRAQRGDGEVAHVMAVDQQPAAADIEEARQQMHQRSLARSAGADNGDYLARR